MASKAKSRWADDEADAALEAQLKREKEEKKRLKAEKARKLEAERQAREAAAAAAAQQEADSTNGPPAKRRRISPNRETSQTAEGRDASNDAPKLLRFEGGAFGRCRSVENYDKLNDIEEGAYGWVSRAKEIATGKVVALKRLKIDPKDRSGLPVTGLREIQILKDCDHRNVVKLQEVVVGEDTSRIEKYSCFFPSPEGSIN
jgi:cell division cycle 2-like protein